MLNCAVFGAMFRPLEPVKPSKLAAERKDEETSVGTPLMLRIKRARDENLRNADNDEVAVAASCNSINSARLVGVKPVRSSTTDSISSLQRASGATPAKPEGGSTTAVLAMTGSKRSLTTVQPMNRDDAFLFGSLQRIPQYRQDPANYHASVTRVNS